MFSKKLLILGGVLIIVFFAYFIFKGSYSVPVNTDDSVTSTPSVARENPATASGVVQSQISIKNFSFDPQSITIKPGTTVTWINNDSVPHTITSDPDGATFKSQTLQPGEKFQFTFASAGTFPYHCSIHPSMQGNIVVVP